MSKAILGVSMLAADAAMYAGLVLMPVASIPLVLAFNELEMPLLAGGVSLLAGAAATALTQNRGMEISSRQPAALRQIVYGEQRIGGVTVYQSTSGQGVNFGYYILNYVIVLATHEIDSVINLYLDGRRVFWKQDGSPGNVGCGSVATPPTCTVTRSGGVITGITATGGSGFCNVKPTSYRVRIVGGGGTGADAIAHNSGPAHAPVWTVTVLHGGINYTTDPVIDIQGAYNFGGVFANDEQDPSQPGYGLGYGIGPGGPHYQMDGKGYCEVRFGDQINYDYISSLFANDEAWVSTNNLMDCAYVYLNVGYDPTLFNGPPEIKFTVTGKNDIYDPRTDTKGYSTNWALQVADVITDPEWGVGDDTVNQAQLIAAANVCDETVMTSQGGEPRYQQHIHYDTSTAPGDVLSLMMPSAGGRLSRIAGEYFIWPAYWQGPSFTLDESSLIDAVAWNPYRSFKDLVNCVNGTYIAPNYPYQCTGNYFDSNGFYYGITNNLWPFAWQPTSFPQYAVDTLHGYGSDIFLLQDGGVVLPKELSLRGVISVTQAQRVAKIELMRNRQQGSGTFEMGLAALAMQPTDTIQFSFPAMGWLNKVLEIDKIQLKAQPLQGQSGEEGPMALTVSVSVNEADPSVYEWALGEELTPTDRIASPFSRSSVVQPPTSLVLTDDTTTAVLQSDGTYTPRMLVTWVPPDDVYVNTGGSIQVQWKDSTGVFLSGGWIDAGSFSGSATYCYVTLPSSVTAPEVQIRAIRSSGATSVWVSSTLAIVPAHVLYNQYKILPPICLSNPTPTTIVFSAPVLGVNVEAIFGSLPAVQYSNRTFTIPVPTVPTWYYVTIADNPQNGETSATLTATCQTADTLVGVLPNVFMGAIQATPAGGGGNVISGGWPSNWTFTYQGPVGWARPHPSVPTPPGPRT